MSEREEIKCQNCQLVQFRRLLDTCRRCGQSTAPPPPPHAPAPRYTETNLPTSGSENLATAVRETIKDFRLKANLTQRQLGTRMKLPRTYISKIEQGRAIPTLASLQRFSAAMEVPIGKLIQTIDDRSQVHRLLSAANRIRAAEKAAK